MAKVKFSALVSEMRNKLNGSVFSRNRGGQYLRTKVTPVNPSTGRQVAVRALLSTFSQGWRSLTQEQRDAWISATSQWTTTDVFGDSITPSGNALYVRLNVNIANGGGSPIAVPPQPVGVASLTDLSVSATAGTPSLSVTYAATPVPADTAMVIEASPNLSPGISNANSQMRVVATLAAAEASPYDLLAEYQAKFGSLIAGQKLFVRAKMINITTGEVSQKQQASVIVGA